MVNASLNWASIVGIALAICGGGLYFLRSFKPALARDYDVFFAAIGLLCGGILFFQGWRLDPILQFGQFLLAGTTVFFAYESVRLRGLATDQARRSSYFEDEFDSPPRSNPNFSSRFDNDLDQFQETEPISRSRRFGSRQDEDYESSEDDFYRSRRTSRPAIPEQAASRRSIPQRDSVKAENRNARRMARFENSNNDELISRRPAFGERRTVRQDERRGSRPRPTSRTNRSDNYREDESSQDSTARTERRYRPSNDRNSSPKGTPINKTVEDAAFTSSRAKSSPRRSSNQGLGDNKRSNINRNGSYKARNKNSRDASPRDNTSRFDD